MKRIIAVVFVVATFLLMLCGCNVQIFDTTYKFDYAYIELPGGDVVKGYVESWKDFEDGDQLQIVIDGKTYLTDTTRAVLVKN